MSLLEVENLSVAYGAIEAVRDASLSVEEGEVVALIGANGAGKTTTLNAVSGMIKARSGSIKYDGRDVRRMRPESIVRAGLVQVPEGREVFANMNVAENLMVAAWRRRDRAQAERDIAAMLGRFPILEKRRRQPAGNLSGGEQQILAIARGLIAGPRLLLLDEPSLGLAPQRVDEVFEIIRGIREQGTTILLVEQNALRALDIADRAYVMELGTTTISGTGQELLANPDVRRAYLGV
ncbi:MAG TPA: ABC transporter ATP-binding protein [Candidatus Dormibacteraeota bacterium]|jgi:branched-chain amino acid transport system ATP-binding protein|nr:ABC transporter ATP-binding protein [Candidatus Dormibacteraeota bacterium]